jgi:hypothetical protein
MDIPRVDFDWENYSGEMVFHLLVTPKDLLQLKRELQERGSPDIFIPNYKSGGVLALQFKALRVIGAEEGFFRVDSVYEDKACAS